MIYNYLTNTLFFVPEGISLKNIFYKNKISHSGINICNFPPSITTSDNYN